MRMKTLPLNQVSAGKHVRIVAIDAGRGMVGQLNHMGLFAGDSVKVVQNNLGPLIVAKGPLRLALGRGMSHKILVEESD